MLTGDIMRILEERSPRAYAESWDADNVGLQVGNPRREVSVVYLALDATPEVVEDAIDKGAHMLITHHPLIFGGIRKVNTDDSVGRRVLALAENRISYMAMHTNYDVMGMADRAADILGIEDACVFFPTAVDEDGRTQGIGRVGMLPEPMSLGDLAQLVKERFGIDSVRIFGDPDAGIRSAAISPGSGKSMVETALTDGADVLITGDIDHHTGIDAVAEGLCIIDAGHYGLEHIFIDEVAEFLNGYFYDNKERVQVIKEPVKSPFSVV
ncbi:MAG: Nif3-like dinuclear metal center hexameric protein [Eubacterium sp.]|nr:Nif3-like dinuclear metal center hexameric protein [Eubacterium sp.]